MKSRLSRCATRLLAGAATTVLAAAGLVAAAPQAGAAPVDGDAWYVLQSRHSGLVMDINGASTADGAELVQYTRTDNHNQQFRFADSGDGYYRLIARHSGKAIDVVEWSTTDGAQVQQWPDNNYANQQWRMVDIDGGAYVKLINRNSGKALDVWEWSTTTGTRISQYTETDGANQQWQLIQVDDNDQSGTFRNPLLPNGADPWLEYFNGYYYLSTTTWDSTVIMRRSTTLAGLGSAPATVVWDDSGVPDRCCSHWAPEFHRIDGTWYLMYTSGFSQTNLDGQKLRVLRSTGDTPMGPYEHMGTPMPNTWNIDGSYLELNGRLYLLWSEWDGPDQSIWISAMANPWTVTGPRVIISRPSHSWEVSGSRVNEAPEPLQHNGDTFIVFSASSCNTPDYKLGLLTHTGGDPLSASSWSKAPQPVFSAANGVYGPGHNGFFTSPDGTENWIVYHGNASADQGCGSTRSTRAQPFTWNSDGTPDFGQPVSTGTDVPVPSGEGG